MSCNSVNFIRTGIESHEMHLAPPCSGFALIQESTAERKGIKPTSRSCRASFVVAREHQCRKRLGQIDSSVGRR